MPAYIGHNDNKLAELRVEPQLKVTKSAAPSSQMPGEEVTYQITVRNTGDTQIPAPIVITDVLPADFMFLRMGDNSPGDPFVDDKTLVWDSIPQLAPGDSFVFSFVAEVDGPIDETVKNYVAADSTETPLCEIDSAPVTILSPFVGDKFGESWNHETVMLGNNELPLVRQGDPLTYTASIYNRSPRTTYTITHFLDILDDESLAAKDRTGLVNSLDQSFEYLYTLPAPFVLDPDGQWEHTFGATMRGLGTGSLWCNNKEQIDKAKVEQAKEHVLYLLTDNRFAFNPKKLAPVYVLPHVSMYQQAYPNPVAIGEVVTVVLTLRDNRTNPTIAVTGLDLQWTAPKDFTLLDANPVPTSSDETSASWSNVDIPAGGEQVFLIHMRAPVQKEPGWSRKYSATAEVLALDDANICVPKSTRFVESKSGGTQPDHDTGLPGPIPDYGDQKYVQLEVNQGIELKKTAKPKEIGPYGMVEYEIVIKNLTGAPVAPVAITDTLPYLDISNWEYLETTSGMQPHSENPLYWNIGLMEPLSEVRMVLKTRAASWLGLALNNLAGSAPININYHKSYTDNMSVNVVSGIGFYKVAEPTLIQAGEATTYTIKLYNGALYDIQSVVITDTLPPGFYFDEMVAPLGLQPQISETQLIWTIPSKINREGGVYEIVFRARTRTLAEGMLAGKYYNTVIASAKKSGTGEPVEMPPTGPTAPVDVEGLATVNVHKTATPQTAMQGQEVVYHIALRNQYTETRTLQITDTLPVHFTLAELIDPPNADTAYVGDQQQITWRDITLAAGAEMTITFRAKVDEDAAPGRYDNVIQMQIDDRVLPPSQPMASVWVEELPRADGKISKTDDRLIAQKGSRIDYTITYHNASAEMAFESVVLTETISPISYVTVLGGDWTPVGNGSSFRREIFEVLEPGESRTVQFSVELSPDIPDDYQWLHNQVELGYTTDGPVIESTPGDNVAEDVNRIIGSGDSVVIVKAASYAGDMLVAGQELTYTITLFNVLTQTQSVRITDTLPVSFTLSAPLSPPAIELTQTVDSHQLVVWDGLTIPGEDSLSIIFRARVDPDAEQGIACNSVQVQLGDGQVIPSTGPLACVDVQRLWKVDAYVSKANIDDKGWASPGDTLNYLIQYGNATTSQMSLATIVLTETVSPPAVIEAMVSDHWVSLGNGKYRRTLSGADLAPGGTGQLYFSIRLSDTIPANVTSVHNQVEIGFTTVEPSVEVNPSNNVSTDVTEVQNKVYLPLVLRKK